MQEVMDIPHEKSAPHPKFGEFFFGAQNPEYNCVQDGKHAIVKAASAMKNNVLSLGKYSISVSYLKNLLAREGRVTVGISEADLEANKDAMDYDLAAKLCHPQVTTLLTAECDQGTCLYLGMMEYFIKAYIDEDTPVDERLFNAWYCVFFCRIWKDSLQEAKKPLDSNFISRNLQASIEINGHALTVFVVRCRDEEKPEMCLPHLAGSQPCEGSFKTLRTMSTSLYTRVNFNVKEALDSLKRVQLVSNIAASPGDFKYTEAKKRQKKHETAHVPAALLDDEGIKKIVGKGNKHVRNHLQAVGIEPKPGFPVINLSKPPTLKTHTDKDPIEPEELAKKIDKLEPAFIDSVDDLQILLQRLENAPLDTHGRLPDIELPENKLRIISPEHVGELSNKEKNNFIFFARDEEVFKVPKSTVLFMITEKGKSTPIDRLQRFITDNKPLALINSTTGRCDKICIGDWVVMEHDDNVYYCLVLGFRYTATSGVRRKFKQNFCPVTKPKQAAGLENDVSRNKIGENIEVKVNTFLASTGGLLSLHDAFNHENSGFINIAQYLTHVKVLRNRLSGNYFIE